MLVLGLPFLERSGLTPMLGSFVGFFLVFAQAVPAAKGAEPSLLVQLAPFIPIPIIFYFLMIRPQQMQDRKRRELINTLKKNDKVLTAAGMYGTVISVDEKGDRVQLRLDDDGKVKITFTKASIVRVLSEPVE
jgi:preprotein translocase subunit YajC